MYYLLVILFYVFTYSISAQETISEQKAIICEDYNETACLEYGDCETTTRTCDDPNQLNTCFVLWSNSTNGTVSVKMKGCFGENNQCAGKDTCVDTNDIKRRKTVFYCCCDTDYCNRDFYYDPTVEPADDPESEMSNILQILPVYVTFSITIFVVLVVAAVFCCKKDKPFKEVPIMDSSSEEDLDPIEPERDIKLISVKAHGRFGVVWKALYDSKEVAVKIFPREGKESWLTEQEIYKKPMIEHENILSFIGVEQLAANYWLITDYHELGSLQDFLSANIITWEQLIHIMHTMMRGLDHLHEEIPSKNKPSIAHRDFKSSNVLLKHDLSACIADFELAYSFEEDKPFEKTHCQVGTRRYMAPEILQGSITFYKESFLYIDMYACALVLWEILSRCSVHDEPLERFKLPYEEELGLRPSLQEIQDFVVNRKERPVIKDSWKMNPALTMLCETIEDCWDKDPEARLTSSCVLDRIEYHLISPPVPHNDDDDEVPPDEETSPSVIVAVE